MPKAKTIDRLALTKSRSKYLQAVEEMKQERHEEELSAVRNFNLSEFPTSSYEKCPVCGAKLLHIGGCVECPNKCYSKCG